ncbi:biopolymer transporter TonB [Novosphingobium barchaimii LL02]|uniref:Biopolymer transporter TonB n=1 Tax=Novosphingobium barchaimii LL02 TaxID=1114963 RepID=A0A0J7YA17_9SPHN|nr:TonB family protein [Novosphingobium barchaimii]KMS60178.1 biopolymer transporter TonB [Novosphingobium barchaimii LL02]
MTRFQFRSERRPRWGAAGAVLLIHFVLVAGLIRAFTPDIAAKAVRAVMQAVTVSLEPPSAPDPEPSPTIAPRRAPPKEEGAAGAPASKATPREVSAPRAAVVVRPTQAPQVADKGEENASGASGQGDGTGASGIAKGTGAGAVGTGGGGGGTGKPTVKIAGEISSAKDYPRASRELRIGASVVIDLSVGADGRVKGCRVVQHSPDSQADGITCTLAVKRFRFDPALDPRGSPIEAVYRWRQRWFY